MLLIFFMVAVCRFDRVVKKKKTNEKEKCRDNKHDNTIFGCKKKLYKRHIIKVCASISRRKKIGEMRNKSIFPQNQTSKKKRKFKRKKRRFKKKYS